MKAKLYLSLVLLFALSFSLQAQRFADDILLHECDSEYRIEPQISVADNGWIYVMMNKYSESSAETRIYRSTDGGVTFQQIMYQVIPAGNTQGGAISLLQVIVNQTLRFGMYMRIITQRQEMPMCV